MQRGQPIGLWDGVAQKNDDRHVTQNNLNKIRVLALQVFEAGSKTYCQRKYCAENRPRTHVTRQQLR